MTQTKLQDGDVIGVEQIAALFNDTHPVTVRRWFKNKEIPGKKIGGAWFASRDAIIRMLATSDEPKGGGEEKCPTSRTTRRAYIKSTSASAAAAFSSQRAQKTASERASSTTGLQLIYGGKSN